jgi:hypothetical protein
MSGALNLSQLDGVKTGFSMGVPSAPAPAAAPAPINLSSLDGAPPAAQPGANSVNISGLDSTPTTNINAGAAQPSTQKGGILRNLGAGALDAGQAMNAIVNAPFDAINNAENGAGWKINQKGGRFGAATVQPVNPQDADQPESPALSGPKFLQAMSDKIQGGINGYEADTQTKTPLDYIARGVGQVAPYALTGDLAGVGAAAKTIGTMALAGAGSGIGSDFGQTVDPNGIGSTIGSLVGGILPLGGAYAASKALEGLGDIAPVTKGLQNQQVSRILQSSDPNLAQTRATIQNRLTPGAAVKVGDRSIPLGPNGEILPSADPNTAPSAAQLSGSLALAKLEEGLKASGEGDVLQAKDTAQATSRAAAVRQLDPDDGDASTLGDYFRRAQQTQDEAYQQQVGATSAGRDAALGQISGASGEIGTYQAGQQIQGALQGADAARKAQADRLFGALREKNPVIDMSSLKGATDDIQQGIENSKAGDVSPVESGLLARASDLATAKDTDWGQVQQFRSEVNNAISKSTQEFGAASPSTRRLMGLKNGIDSATADGVGKLPQQDESWSQYLDGDVGRAKAGLEQLSADGRASASSGENGLSASAPGSGTSASPNLGNEQSGSDGAASAGTRYAQRDTASAQGDVATGWSAADRDTYAQALAAHAARKQLYANPEIGPLLAKAPGGDLKLAPEEVVKRAVPTGPAGARMARAIKATAGDNPAISDYYRSVVGIDLRNSVVRDGQVNRGLLQSWTRNHGALLNEMPELHQHISSLDTAQQFVDEAAHNAALSRDVFNTRAISALIDGHDPSTAMQALLGGSADDAGKFMAYVRRDPAAVAGAQKAMADHLAQSLLTPTGAEGGSEVAGVAKVRALIRNPSKMAILRSVSGDDAPRTLQKIVDAYDLHNTAAISRLGATGARTTPLAEVVRRINEPRTTLGRIFQHLSASPVANTVAGNLAGGPLGGMAAYTGTAVAKAQLSKSRAAVARLLSEALSDPRVFMKMTAPVPQNATAAARFLQQFRGLLANSAMQKQGKNQ